MVLPPPCLFSGEPAIICRNDIISTCKKTIIFRRGIKFQRYHELSVCQELMKMEIEWEMHNNNDDRLFCFSGIVGLMFCLAHRRQKVLAEKRKLQRRKTRRTSKADEGTFVGKPKRKAFSSKITELWNGPQFRCLCPTNARN